MIRTQVRCDKRVSFRDRREGWTCVCPSPGVARTHMATRTVSLRAGNPRQAWTRPSPTAPMRWRVLRSTNAGYNHTGLSGGIEIWGSILDYFFINHTLTRARWPDVPPFRSHRQPAVLLSEAYSLHRITSPLSKLPCLATPLN